MAEKTTFECKAGVNAVEVAVGEKLYRVEPDKPLTVGDPQVIRALAENDGVKVADSPAKAEPKDGR